VAIIAAGRSGVPGHEPDEEKARRDAAVITAEMSGLRKLTPRRASCVWEADYFEPKRQDSFWETILRAIKIECDPDGLLFLHHCVGSGTGGQTGSSRYVIWEPVFQRHRSAVGGERRSPDWIQCSSPGLRTSSKGGKAYFGLAMECRLSSTLRSFPKRPF
jgi:hypothetical protein